MQRCKRRDTRRTIHKGGGKITAIDYLPTGTTVIVILSIPPKVIGSHHGDPYKNDYDERPRHPRNRS